LVEAKITRLTKFGAFARITDEIEGLIHISEISDEHIGHPKEVLHEGDEVTLRIIKIEQESHRIGLSLRRVESLAFADMDLKTLEEELTDTDIKVTSPDAQAEKVPEAESKDTSSKDKSESDQSDKDADEEKAPETENEETPSEDKPISDEASEKVPEEKTPESDSEPTESQVSEEATSDESPSGGAEKEQT